MVSARAEAKTVLEALRPGETAEWVRGPLAPDELALCDRCVEGRSRGEPLQHLLGVAHFYGLTLSVGPGVLVPRPETERLVELVLNTLKGRDCPRVLDVGTGSGAIALAVKSERPDATVVATDRSAEALAWARRNATALGLQVTTLQSDLLGDPYVARFAAGCDVLVSNPPYLPDDDRGTLPPEVAHDPQEALFAGDDGLAVARRLWGEARTQLKRGASLWMELDLRNVQRCAGEVASGAANLQVVTHEDLVGRTRFVQVTRPIP